MASRVPARTLTIYLIAKLPGRNHTGRASTATNHSAAAMKSSQSRRSSPVDGPTVPNRPHCRETPRCRTGAGVAPTPEGWGWNLQQTHLVSTSLFDRRKKLEFPDAVADRCPDVRSSSGGGGSVYWNLVTALADVCQGRKPTGQTQPGRWMRRRGPNAARVRAGLCEWSTTGECPRAADYACK